MNSSYLNAAAGAFLFIAFVVMTVSIASDAIFHASAPETEGFAIAVAEGTTETGGAEEESLTPIATLLVDADAERGAAAFRKCQSCHTVEEGGANRVGPNLWKIVERPMGTADGFGYSTALSDYSEGGEKSWTYEELNHFLQAPKKYMRGTSMGFAGLKKDDERADVIAYLRSLSDTPVPLPDPEGQEASEEAADDVQPEPASAETETAGDDATGEATSEAATGDDPGAADADSSDDASETESDGDADASEAGSDDKPAEGTSE